MRRIAAVLVAIGCLIPATPAFADGPPEPANTYTVAQLPKTSTVPIKDSNTEVVTDGMAAVQAAPAAVYAEASTITTQAQYNTASPAAQNLYSTTVKIKHKVKAVAEAPPPKPATGSYVTMADGTTTKTVWPPACWGVKITDAGIGIFGQTNWTNNIDVKNWCWVLNLYDYWVIYSQPYKYWWTTTHWDWSSCGISGTMEGWVNPPFEWGSAVTVRFGRIINAGSVYCFPDPFNVNSVDNMVGVWVYGWGRYDYT